MIYVNLEPGLKLRLCRARALLLIANFIDRSVFELRTS